MTDEPRFPLETVEWFFYMFGKLVTVVGRNEPVLGVQGVITIRETCVIPLFLAERGVTRAGGAKRLRPFLSEEQHSLLEELPPFASTLDWDYNRATVEQRVSLITLGVADVGRARAFYEALGWTVGDAPGDVVFFQAGGMIVALWSREQLAADSAVEDRAMENQGGWGGVTLALNVGSPAEVDAVIEEARAAGATIGREPAATFWGGYSGLFLDPDGHPWEVAHNPGWTLRDDGSVSLTP